MTEMNIPFQRMYNFQTYLNFYTKYEHKISTEYSYLNLPLLVYNDKIKGMKEFVFKWAITPFIMVL